MRSPSLSRSFFLVFAAALLPASSRLEADQGAGPRHAWSLDAGWRTTEDPNPHRYDGFEQPAFDDHAWTTVDVPHSWDEYGGEHGLVHGNLHGTAWYRRGFDLPAAEEGRHVLLYFEGVGSYATVWVNGHLAGTHAGGRTTFTLDVTPWVRFGASNELAVRADHPADIQDLPWVCGGCSNLPGFSEGSQPMGIFRPVHMITASGVRVTPFGVHVWNDDNATAASAALHVTTSVRNDEAAFLDEIGSPAVKSCIDFANAWGHGHDACAELRTLGPDRIAEIHCTDKDGVWLQNDPKANPREIKATLDAMGWSGWLVIERSRDARRPCDVVYNFSANAAYLKTIFR